MKKKRQSPWLDPGLKEVREKALKQGIWLQIVDETPGHCMAAAGSLQELKNFGEKIARWARRNIRKNKLKLGDCIDSGAVPGVGKTPVEACRRAIRALKKELKNRSQ